MTPHFATPADLPGLLALYRHLSNRDLPGDLAHGADVLRQLALWPGSGIVVLGTPARASCTLIVAPNLSRHGKPYALIENVVTDPAHRRQGLGHHVLAHAIDAAWQAGCYKVMLLTGRSDPGVLRFYERAGFAQTKTGFQIRRA